MFHARAPPPTKVAALVSGGKDGILAAHCAQCAGWDVTHLVTVQPGSPESYMFHVPNTAVAGPLVARAMRAPLVEVAARGGAEAEVDDLERALAPLGVDGFVSGAIASEYQRVRLERLGHRLGLKSFTPLWHKAAREVLATVSGEGWDVRFSAVAAEGLGAAWLGRRLDEAAARELLALHARLGVHPAGEGGEYESLVLDAPCYHERIEVGSARADWRRDGGVWVVEEARLAAKARAPRQVL
jgi:ABC transporter with metal-binding/Fe-S-binding domain ATP-binding protein